MTEYVKSTNFASKDSLSVGNPLKIVKGTEIDGEFNNIATAVATKADIVSPTFTGVPAAPTATAGTNTTQVATTAFVGTAVSNAVTAYDTALTVSTSQIEDGAVTNAKLASGAAVSNIGFTPVQQGGGPGQNTNKVNLGWDNDSKFLISVDNVSMGALVLDTTFASGNQSLSGNGYQKLPGGLIMQWGNTGSMSGGQNLTVTYPIAFPNAVVNVQTTVIVSTDTNEITHVYSVGTSTFVVANSNPGSITGVYWLAFGY